MGIIIPKKGFIDDDGNNDDDDGCIYRFLCKMI